MDKFTLPEISFDDPFAWDQDKSLEKIIRTAQFLCLPNESGLAVAFHNFWIYHYDINKTA